MASLKQKLLAKEILVNRGKSIGKAMRKVGFSKAYAKNPAQLEKTKSWKDLMNKFISEEKLAKLHSEQLSATKTQPISKFSYGKTPDNDARLRALDLGYKLRGRYAAEKIDIKSKYGDLSNKDLAEKINKLKGFLMKK